MKNFCEKVWKFKNKAYLCIPARKTGIKKFIEKTVLLYKKQVPRNTIYREALILLEELKVSGQAKRYKKIYNEEFDPGSG